MAHTRRNIILGLIGAGLVGGLVYTTFRAEPIAVDVEELARGPLIATVDVDGVTRVSDLFEIAAPITGIAQRSPVAVGDPVVAGQTVVAMVQPASPGLLDRRTRLQAEAAVREAEAAVNVATTERAQAAETHAYAISQYDRTQALVERGVTAISRLEDDHQRVLVAEATLASADARILQAQGALDRAQAALIETSDADVESSCCEPILAPATGVVLDIDTISERPVTAGMRLLSIGDPQSLEIVADLLSADAVRLPQETRASVERWGGEPLEARMVRIEPTARTQISALGIEEQRVDVVFEFTSPPADLVRLGHGFSVFLRVVEVEVPDALLVPLSATFRNGDGWAAFRVIGDRVERVEVELGEQNARFINVVSGLETGDRVVVHPNDALADGALIVERSTF